MDKEIQESRPCCICGNESFIPGPNGRLTRGLPPCCSVCRSLERHRIIYSAWKSLESSILKRMNCLHFAPERCMEKSWFKRYTPSIYGKGNSIDMQNIYQYPDQCWDVVIANHVLEHIPNDLRALREIRRILKNTGLFQFTVPLLGRPTAAKTVDWGHPIQWEHGHFRNYGLDLMKKLCQAFPGDFLLTYIGTDVVTGVQEYVYFLGDKKLLKKMAKNLNNTHLEKLAEQKQLLTMAQVIEQYHEKNWLVRGLKKLGKLFHG